ncbi:MAG TPA: DUF5715 family protein [Longimicrobiales bacterium]
MTIRTHALAALLALLPATAFAAGGSLRGSPSSMNRQHDIAVDEELTFYRTPGAILAEVAEGTLTSLDGNENYRVANVSFAYAVPEVRMFVERIAEQYRNACNEQLVVTSLTRPKNKQPRNAHVLSVHPAGMAVDLRISERAQCRSWLEKTLLSLEGEQVLDVTRERRPPHYHVAVFPTPYREYAARIDALKPKPAIVLVEQPRAVPVQEASIAVVPTRQNQSALEWSLPLLIAALFGLNGMRALYKKRRRSA